MTGKIINAAIAALIVLYGGYLYKKYRWWVDLWAALVGIAWLVIYAWIFATNPAADIYKVVSDNAVRYVITCTLLAMAINLIQRGRDK